MEAVQGAIGLSPSLVAPRGLGTAELESFSGYAARVSAKIAVPALVFVRKALEDAGGRPVLNTSVAAGARHLHVGDHGPDVAPAVSRLTGHADLGRLSYFAFTKLLGVGERGLLARWRRWCSDCSRADALGPVSRALVGEAVQACDRPSSTARVVWVIAVSAIARATRLGPGSDRRISSCCGVSTSGAS